MKQKPFFLFLRLFLSICAMGMAFAYSIKSENKNVELKRLIPEMEKEVKNIHIANAKLLYEVDCFENPLHLMEFLRKPEFGHLKYPVLPEVWEISKGCERDD